MLVPILIVLVSKRECHGFLMDFRDRQGGARRRPICVQDLVVNVARSGRRRKQSRGLLQSHLPDLGGRGAVKELGGGGFSVVTPTLCGNSTPSSEDPNHPHYLDWFVTPPMTVYIEDTDAYGMMYNGNYLRAYDRALHAMVTTTATTRGASVSPTTTPRVLHDDNWSIVGVEEIMFKSPPPLGGVFCITGTRRRPRRGSFDDDNAPRAAGFRSAGTSDSGSSRGAGGMDPTLGTNPEAEVWDMTMRSPDGTIVYNKATGVTIALPPHVQGVSRLSTFDESRPAAVTDWLPKPEPFCLSSASFQTSSVDSFRTYRDEFEPHLGSHLPLRNALNLMERSRSNYIGGPAALNRLQAESNILYVVTSVRNCSLISYECSHDDSAFSQRTGPHTFVPGWSVDVETTFRVRRRGMVVDCYHTLLYDHENGSGEDGGDAAACGGREVDGEGRNRRLRMAQGLVTIMALNATTRRPTQDLPSWLSSTFGLG
jgi:hypothetical protein